MQTITIMTPESLSPRKKKVRTEPDRAKTPTFSSNSEAKMAILNKLSVLNKEVVNMIELMDDASLGIMSSRQFLMRFPVNPRNRMAVTIRLQNEILHNPEFLLFN